MSNYRVSGIYTRFYDNSRTMFYGVNTIVINILEGKYNDNKIFAQIYTQNFFFCSISIQRYPQNLTMYSLQ